MSKDHPLAANIEEIAKALMKEADDLSFGALLRKAIAEGVRLGEAGALQRLVQLMGGEATKSLSMIAPGAHLSATAPKPARVKGQPAKTSVKCPVKDCTRPGIKPLHNFCQLHYESMAPEKREALRNKQIAERKMEKKKQLEAERAEAHKAAGKTAA